jgi:hypothetical protein
MLGHLPTRVGFSFSKQARIREFLRAFHQSFLYWALATARSTSLVMRQTSREQALLATY